MSVAAFIGLHRSKILVSSIVVTAVIIGLWARWYLMTGEGLGSLSTLDCERLRPTIAEVHGERIELNRDSVCAVLKDLANAQPTGDGFVDDKNDPWHYIARARIQPEHTAWFMVFVARKSTGFRPELSLRHRREGGWAVVGEFDGEPVLRRLGLLTRINRDKVIAPESREVRDQRQPL